LPSLFIDYLIVLCLVVLPTSCLIYCVDAGTATRYRALLNAGERCSVLCGCRTLGAIACCRRALVPERCIVRDDASSATFTVADSRAAPAVTRYENASCTGIAVPLNLPLETTCHLQDVGCPERNAERNWLLNCCRLVRMPLCCTNLLLPAFTHLAIYLTLVVQLRLHYAHLGGRCANLVGGLWRLCLLCSQAPKTP